MPPITAFWVVRNPAPTSTLADILWRQPVDTLGDYIVGAGVGTWVAEMHTVYLSEGEARADAEARLKAVAAGLSLVRRSDGRVVAVTVPKKSSDSD